MDDFLAKFKTFQNYDDFLESKANSDNDINDSDSESIWASKQFQKQPESIKNFLAGLLFIENIEKGDK